MTNDQSKGLRQAFLAQLFGILGMYSFENGILLLYMTALGVNPVRILTYLAIPNVMSTVVRLPTAYIADRAGKKRLGMFGTLLTALGYTAVPFAGALPLHTAEIVLISGFTVLAIGKMLFACGWLAMLSPLVPEERRGRIFGLMRFMYQLAGIGFAVVCAWMLADNAPIHRFQIITGVLAACFFARFLLYRGVPELERHHTREGSFWKTLGQVVRIEGYAGFCAYVFLLTLFTAGCRSLFALVEKNTLQLSNSQVVILANLSMIGGLCGLFLGGRAVDRWGTKYVFMVCHFGFGLGIAGFLLRGFAPLPLPWTLGLVHFALGTIGAGLGIAVTSELLMIVPRKDKALSTSLGMSMILGGAALSGLLSAGILQLDVLKEHWILLGQTMSSYDAILLAYAMMIVLMVVTLGLVPSVLRKAAWLPQD